MLLDGRRATPLNAGMAVSINMIPSAAIARVESITGGASSVYGADAVAGVVNFITKRDFEGIVSTLRLVKRRKVTVRSFVTRQCSEQTSPMDEAMCCSASSVPVATRFAHQRDYRMRGFLDNRSLSQTDFYSAAGYSPVAANQHDPAVLEQIFSDAPGPMTTGGQYYMNSDGTPEQGARRWRVPLWQRLR